MKVLSICVAVLALNALVSGCQKREPTRPAQPTVSDASIVGVTLGVTALYRIDLAAKNSVFSAPI
jgi:hypothetical protein